MRIDIGISDGEAFDWIYSVLERAQNLHPVTKRIADDMKSEVIMNFLHQGRPHWKPIKSSWRERKAKNGYSTRILEMTGALKSSFGTENTNNRSTVFSDIRYSIYHEEGAPRAHIPQREFLQFPDTKTETYSQWIENYLFGGGY